MVEIVPVDRADIIKAQLFKHRPASEEGTCKLFRFAGFILQELRQFFGNLLGGLAHAAVGFAGNKARQISAHGAGRWRNRHIVVVEDDDEARIERTGIVHRFIGHARRHGTIANNRNYIALLAREIGGDRHAKASGNRCR
ncbi:hypothetical protein D3C80_264580 [compost metagenome]